MAETISLERIKIQKPKNKLWVFRIMQNGKAMMGVVILCIFVLLALLAPILKPGDPGNFVARANLLPSMQYPLGTMVFGQDGLAQLLWGSRTSLSIGFETGIFATF